MHPRFAITTFSVLLLAAASAREGFAQAQKYEGKEVVTIQFVPAQQPLEPSELFEILPLKLKQPLQMAVVRASIERLFATGRYSDVQVDAEPYQNGVVIRFLTKASWFVGNVAISGEVSDPPNAGQLENAARLELGEPFSEERVQQGIEGQKHLLESNGLFGVDIQPFFDYDPVYQQVHIRFEVANGRRARYSEPVIAGDLKTTPKKLVAATRWHRWLLSSWRPMTQARTRRGLDGILNFYQREKRLEARVNLDEMKYDPETGHVTPNLSVEAGPTIEVNTIGAKLSKKRLQRLVPIFEERTVDHDLLVEGARNLRDYFQADGYFETQVEVKPQRVVNDKATIDYLVNTGRRHRLAYIEIQGNHYFTTPVIRERMFLEPASPLQFRHGRYSESLLRRDEEAIANLYRSNGFRDASVAHVIRDDYRGRAGDIAVFLTIQEGPQYFINSLEVEGIEKVKLASVLATLSSAEGQPFSEFNVAVDRDTILAGYFERGFPNATFEWSAKPAAQPHRIDLRFVVREGSEQFVRQVLITGLRTTRKSLVSRNLGLNPGDPLSPTAVNETQRRLYDLGVFARVDTAIQNPDGETPSKYVVYEMDEARRYSVAVGLGAEVAKIGGCQTCFDAPAGQAGFAPRVSLDVARNNLWGLAHSLSLRGRFSTLQERALLNYSAPRFRNREGYNVSFTGLFDESRDVRTFSSKRLEGSAQLSQRISKASTLFYRYTYRRVSVDEGTLKITPFLIPLLAQPVRLGQVSISLIQDRRDDPVEPRKGIYNTVDLGLAERVFGSQRNFLRFLGRNSSYHSLTRKLTLARSTTFGNIYSFRFEGDPLQAIPLPERLYGGGGTTSRGFPENQAGPRDPITGFPLGGTAMLFNQTELRFPLLGDNVGGVIFHDAGNVYATLSRVSFRVQQHGPRDFDYMTHAAGMGIRYRTPVGPVRVDLSYSINPPSFVGFSGSQQDLVNAGVAPCVTAPARCTLQNVSHFQFFFSIGQTF